MRKPAFSLLLSFALAVVCLAACDDTKPKPRKSVPDAGVSDASSAMPDAGATQLCNRDPQSHAEIINACTDAEVVDKHPALPLLLSDGGLPPLP